MFLKPFGDGSPPLIVFLRPSPPGHQSFFIRLPSPPPSVKTQCADVRRWRSPIFVAEQLTAGTFAVLGPSGTRTPSASQGFPVMSKPLTPLRRMRLSPPSVFFFAIPPISSGPVPCLASALRRAE